MDRKSQSIPSWTCLSGEKVDTYQSMIGLIINDINALNKKYRVQQGGKKQGKVVTYRVNRSKTK